MLLNEAIDRNIELRGELLREGRLEKAEAVSWGIEALKREQSWRQRWPHQSHLPFPGETEE